MNNIAYLLALHSISGFGPVRLKTVLDYFQDPKSAWEASLSEIRKTGIPQTIAQRLQDAKTELNPGEYLENIQKAGIRWLTLFDPDYPQLLKEIYDPPVVLYYTGELLPEDAYSIAVVGTRKMTSYGQLVTKQLTKGLSDAGLTIVSGLARGVDSQAHSTAVSEKGRTIAVLGSGHQRIFPPENIGLANRIAAGCGAVVSEFPPDCPSTPGNFPARNRIISGLSLAVLVTEAAGCSGSLITASLALEQGREVFAVPGPVTSCFSKGPIDLIKKGAIAVTSTEEILEELKISGLVQSINAGIYCKK